jgi:pimeloyl-ACP methyl ester carboxylesterase
MIVPPIGKYYFMDLAPGRSFVEFADSRGVWLFLLRQPTLVLSGKDDPLVPAVNGRILSFMIPGAQLRLFDDGHLS